MADDKGYKDTKQFICVGCGKEIILTKFASQKTCKCDDCKTNNVPINPDIVAQALSKNPPKERKKSDGGATKILPCIKCGKSVEVSKFMSAQKVLCNECKGTAQVSGGHKISIDYDVAKSIKMPPLEEYEMNGGIIANKGLREVTCPSCGHKYMKPLMVVDWSQFGMIIAYQCQSCYTRMDISEQSRQKTRIFKPSERFDYTGRQMHELGMNYRDSSRLANSLCTLIEICEKHDINIDDELSDFHESLPPYRFENDKPVTKGWVIPPEDKWMSIVENAINWINANAGDNTDASNIADKLNSLLKGDY